jgi:hypothetical protein
MKASTILFFLFFTPIFNLQNQYSMEQHKIDQLQALEEKYQELDALYSQHQELIDKYMKPELLQKFKKLGLFIEKEQEKLPQVDGDLTQEEATTQESLSGLQQVQGDLGEVEEGNYEGKSISESLEGMMDDGEDAVGKKEFREIVQEYIDSSYSDARETVKITDENEIIPLTPIKAFISEQKFRTPLGLAMTSEFFKFLKDSTFYSIEGAYLKTKAFFKENKNLNAHYQQYKASYKSKDPNKIVDNGIIEDDIDKFFSTLTHIQTLKEEYEEMEEAVQQEIDEATEEMEEFKEKYGKWVNSLTAELELFRAIDTTNSLYGKTIPKSKFEAIVLNSFSNWDKLLPTLTQDFIPEFRTQLNNLGANGNEINAGEVALIFTEAAKILPRHYEIRPAIFEEWNEHKHFPTLGNLVAKVNNALTNDQSNTIFEKYNIWYDEVYSALDSLDKTPLSSRYYKTKVLQYFKDSICGGLDHRKMMYPIIEKHMSSLKTEIPSFNEFIIAWKKALVEIHIMGEARDQFFETKLATYTNQDDAVAYVQGLSLPDSSEIQKAFGTEMRYYHKVEKLKKGASVQNISLLSDMTLLTAYISTSLERDAQTQEVYATISELEIIPDTSKSDLKYSFELRTVTPGSPIKDGESWKTPLEVVVKYEKDLGSTSNEEVCTDGENDVNGTENSESNGRVDHENTITQPGHIISTVGGEFNPSKWGITKRMPKWMQKQLEKIAIEGELSYVPELTIQESGTDKTHDKTEAIFHATEIYQEHSYGTTTTDNTGKDQGYLILKFELISNQYDNKLQVMLILRDHSSSNAQGDFDVIRSEPIVKEMDY